jgi:hypothetical protein
VIGNVNVDLESETVVKLLSRILKVGTLLAIVAAVVMVAAVMPSRKAHFAPEQTACCDSGPQSGKPSPFPASAPRTSVSRRPRNYLPDSTPPAETQ